MVGYYSIHNFILNIGTTTRYWDCCKPSCAWPDKGPSSTVATCSKDGGNVIGNNDQSGCNGGPSFTCNNQQPWAKDDNLAYGFAAFNGIAGQGSPCCKCYELTFTSGPVNGKKMIVQVKLIALINSKMKPLMYFLKKYSY